VSGVIKNLNPKILPGYDLITNQILQELLEIGIKCIIYYVIQSLDGVSFHLNGR
jgi:hypothetical protein